jgi:hypothetical protein
MHEDDRIGSIPVDCRHRAPEVDRFVARPVAHAHPMQICLCDRSGGHHSGGRRRGPRGSGPEAPRWAGYGTSDAPLNGVAAGAGPKPAAGRASSRTKAITNRTTRTLNVVDSRNGRRRLAIDVESTCDRYIRAIHAHGTVPYGATDAQGRSARGRAAEPAQRASGGRIRSGARVRPNNEWRPGHDHRGSTPGGCPPQHDPDLVCDRPTVERPDQPPW